MYHQKIKKRDIPAALNYKSWFKLEKNLIVPVNSQILCIAHVWTEFKTELDGRKITSFFQVKQFWRRRRQTKEKFRK